MKEQHPYLEENVSDDTVRALGHGERVDHGDTIGTREDVQVSVGANTDAARVASLRERERERDREKGGRYERCKYTRHMHIQVQHT